MPARQTMLRINVTVAGDPVLAAVEPVAFRAGRERRRPPLRSRVARNRAPEPSHAGPCPGGDAAGAVMIRRCRHADYPSDAPTAILVKPTHRMFRARGAASPGEWKAVTEPRQFLSHNEFVCADCGGPARGCNSAAATESSHRDSVDGRCRSDPMWPVSRATHPPSVGVANSGTGIPSRMHRPITRNTGPATGQHVPCPAGDV